MSNETLEQIEKYVAGTGWYVIKVMEGPAGEPAFAYTIGLTATFGHAELIILGLDLDDMHLILNDIAEAIKQGRTYSAGSVIHDVLVEADCLISNVLQEWRDEYLLLAQSYYGEREFSALQCLWPDGAGRFPGDPDFDIELIRSQPLLSRKPLVN